MTLTQTVRLAYGDIGLDIEVDSASSTVIEPIFTPPVADLGGVMRKALREPTAGLPLRDRVHRGQTVAIAACDVTRPQPRRSMIPAIIEELDGLVDLDDITVLVATGTHRANTDVELAELFGEEVLGSVRVINHDSRDRNSLRWLGIHGANVPVWLARDWVDADVRITTGFVEPHFFAGFSGGPKLVAPGLAGLETVLCLHDARRIGDPMARWGVTKGNPVHDDVRAIAAATGVTFGFDVVLNRDQEVIAAYGGDLFAMHARAIAHARRMAMRPVPDQFDVVVTSNSGYPLDQNLYQTVKGMSAAHQVARPGATIICAAECRDGFPDHGEYRSQLASATSPEALLQDIRTRPSTIADQWQVQIQARIQAECHVVMHTSYLSDAALAEVHLEQTADISASIARSLKAAGRSARVCVLPQGPQTIPYVA